MGVLAHRAMQIPQLCIRSHKVAIQEVSKDVSYLTLQCERTRSKMFAKWASGRRQKDPRCGGSFLHSGGHENDYIDAGLLVFVPGAILLCCLARAINCSTFPRSG